MTSGAEGAWGQAQAFLAHARSAVDPQFDPSGPGVLHWYDAARGVEITLRVDPATGVPQEMRQLTRATGTVMVVTYSGWKSENP
jgi:hypothetical protein